MADCISTGHSATVLGKANRSLTVDHPLESHPAYSACSRLPSMRKPLSAWPRGKMRTPPTTPRTAFCEERRAHRCWRKPCRLAVVPDSLPHQKAHEDLCERQSCGQKVSPDCSREPVFLATQIVRKRKVHRLIRRIPG